MSGTRMSSTLTRQLLSVPALGRDLKVTAESPPSAVAEKLQALSDVTDGVQKQGAPPFVDFEGVACGASAAEVRLRHGLGGRVRWWVVEWETNSTSNFALRKSQASTSTDSVLYLQSYVTGTATIRVEKVQA